MAEGGYSTLAQRPGGLSTFTSETQECVLRPGDSYQNITDWSFDEDPLDVSSILDNDRPSSGSESSSGAGSSGSNSSSNGSEQRPKKVQFSSDSDRLPPYKLHKNSMCRVTFPGRTWDIMRQSFMIALELDNVFICDHFLGANGASALLQELWYLRNSGEFDKSMRKGPYYDYSCMYLSEQSRSHRQLDALVLMVFKLALYFTDQWNKVSVELCYYPGGHTLKTVTTEEYESQRKMLKCVYFPNTDWNIQEEPGVGEEPPGMMAIKTPQRVTKVEPIMDRLVVFWGDILEHSFTECNRETFAVNVFVKRA